MAPSQTESDGSGTRSSGAKSCRIPRPSHDRHIPCGLLKLKSCGLGGSKLNPQVGAGIVRRKQEIRLPLGRDDDRSFAQLEGLLDRFGQPSALGCAQRGHGLEPVDDGLDVVLDLAVERELVRSG